ncbi:hypothetical protein H072_6774 [Dactylellina haptotyla CBS 200.50]|uniref:Methyltransferase type 11 domain-containing protein n=1 Tax=Dactylellina haptotyla (strain CBS 200.50) TaxID=1284197 RepID=S8A8X2_DACHA|nr:hypothetical protein H072_6774 [Dactylellina haptotyla CBS 200.50]
MSEIKNTSYTHENYSAHAGFVPLLTSKITALLSPQPSDKILDLGAGDLILTSKISKHCSQILALDASTDLLTAGRELFPTNDYPNMDTRLVDCRYLDKETDVVDGTWDKVFSNAALHWILRDPSTRKNVFTAVHGCLVPGGKFVAEMGGFGNIDEIHVALTAALVMKGVKVEQVQEANPWFFPSDIHMKSMLEESGFDVEMIELEARPTELSLEDEKGEGGVKAWMEMFGQRFLELVDEPEREAVVKLARNLLEGVSRREDGRWIAGYVRLRWVATKRA